MASIDPTDSGARAPRRSRGLGLLWLIVLVLLGIGGWKAWAWWQSRAQPAPPPPATVASGDVPVGDPVTAIQALRREQHDLAQRMSDATASTQVLRDEVLGVGE